MTGRAIATIALKVWGIVLVIGALMSAPQLIAFLHLPSPGQPQQGFYIQIVLLGFGVRAMVGVLLILLAKRVAAAAVPETAPLMIAGDIADLATVAFCTVGVVVLIGGIGDLASVAVTLVANPVEYLDLSPLRVAWATERTEILRGAVEIVAGAWLVLGRTGLANAWWRLRRGPGASTPPRT